jgi:hypothetical protein
MPMYFTYLQIEDIFNCPLTYKPKSKRLRNRSSSVFEEHTTVRTLRYDQKSTVHERNPDSENSQHHKLGLKFARTNLLQVLTLLQDEIYFQNTILVPFI